MPNTFCINITLYKTIIRLYIMYIIYDLLLPTLPENTQIKHIFGKLTQTQLKKFQLDDT